MYYVDLSGNRKEKRISKRHTFVHITKSGGTAVEKYCAKYYFKYIRGRGHRNICKTLNHPIVIVREPISRFISMYNYWKYGSISGEFTRDDEFFNKYCSYSIKTFIDKVSKKIDDLKYTFTWREHFKQQTCWIPERTYKNTIIIKYTEDLQKSVYKILDYLQIPNRNIPLEKVNVSKKEEMVVLDHEDIENIREIYKEDFELWYKIENHSELFMFVV